MSTSLVHAEDDFGLGREFPGGQVVGTRACCCQDRVPSGQSRSLTVWCGKSEGIKLAYLSWMAGETQFQAGEIRGQRYCTSAQQQLCSLPCLLHKMKMSKIACEHNTLWIKTTTVARITGHWLCCGCAWPIFTGCLGIRLSSGAAPQLEHCRRSLPSSPPLLGADIGSLLSSFDTVCRAWARNNCISIPACLRSFL